MKSTLITHYSIYLIFVLLLSFWKIDYGIYPLIVGTIFYTIPQLSKKKNPLVF